MFEVRKKELQVLKENMITITSQNNKIFTTGYHNLCFTEQIALFCERILP